MLDLFMCYECGRPCLLALAFLVWVYLWVKPLEQHAQTSVVQEKPSRLCCLQGSPRDTMISLGITLTNEGDQDPLLRLTHTSYWREGLQRTKNLHPQALPNGGAHHSHL